jgi:glycosyltransferase involved in cell wall biosynthesis
MRILVFMPRNMRFGPSNASSVDLCVRDLIVASRYRDSTTIVCCENETLFPDLNLATYSDKIDASRRRKLAFASQQVSKLSADLIVVQQHLPTAAILARRSVAPVILHKHNMIKAVRREGVLNHLRRRWRLRQYNSLAGIIFVSHACKVAFHKDWPEVQTPCAVVPNGLDFSQWHPAPRRADEIICVGRAAPEKGIKEAALAMAAVLSTENSWRGRLILAEPNRFPEYLDEILAALRPVAHRVVVEFSQPFSIVKQRYQSAAIAIIPSKWEEPFGRTALEAHAAGCSVISATSGGLPEINANNVLTLPADFDAADIADRLRTLISDTDLRRSLAQRGLAHCKSQFSLENVSASADDFYAQITRAQSELSMPVSSNFPYRSRNVRSS